MGVIQSGFDSRPLVIQNTVLRGFAFSFAILTIIQITEDP
jgi:hypothetical protein